MTDKIYVISCTQDLTSIGLDRVRTAVDGLDARELKLDWNGVRLVPVVATDKTNFEAGEVKLLDIRPIEVPANAIVLNSFWGVNGMGHLYCIGSMEFGRLDEKKTAVKAMFQSRIRSAVLRGDLLGQVMIVPAQST